MSWFDLSFLEESLPIVSLSNAKTRCHQKLFDRKIVTLYNTAPYIVGNAILDHAISLLKLESCTWKQALQIAKREYEHEQVEMLRDITSGIFF